MRRQNVKESHRNATRPIGLWGAAQSGCSGDAFIPPRVNFVEVAQDERGLANIAVGGRIFFQLRLNVL